MKKTISFTTGDGTIYDIPEEQVEAFKADFPDARQSQSFRVGETDYAIPDDMVSDFKKDFPDATPMRVFQMDDGSMRRVTPTSKIQRVNSGDFAGREAMGGMMKGALEAQAQGETVAEEDDGSFLSWLKNAWNTYSHAAGGKMAASDIDWKRKQVMRGVAEKDGGKEVSFMDLPDSELDDYMNSVAPNGYWSYLGNAIGLNIKNDIMSEWDRTEGAKISDPAERKAARVKYAMDLARMTFESNARDDEFARAELEGRDKQWQAGMTSGLVQMAGYATPMMAPGIGIGLSAAVEGATRRNELLADKYETDEDGNVYRVAEGDSRGEALVKGGVGGLATAVVEKFGGKLVGGALSKIPGVKKVAGKLADTKLGHAVNKWMRTYDKYMGWSGVHSAPEEFSEEFVQGTIDAALGLNELEDEKSGTTAFGRTKEFAKEFFSPKNLRDLGESMILMQMIGGGGAYFASRYGGAEADKILKRIDGIDTDKLKDFTAEDKWRAVSAYYNGMSEEQVAEVVSGGAKALDGLLKKFEGDAVKTADGRAGFAEAHPEAAKAIRDARRKGEDVSRKMLRDIGISEEVLSDKDARNAFGDDLLADSRRAAAVKRAKMDGYQANTLAQTISEFVGDTPEAQRVFDRIVMKLKDASVLDDPYQREQLVMQAAEAVYAEDQSQRIGGARQKARMAEKAGHEARLAEAEAQRVANDALAAEQAQRAENDAQERTNAEMMARETKRYDDFMLAREEARAKGGLNEARTDETQQKPDETAGVTPSAGEAARPMEAGKAPSEVGGKVEASKTAPKAPTSASTETKVNTLPTSAEGAEGGSRVADKRSEKVRQKAKEIVQQWDADGKKDGEAISDSPESRITYALSDLDDWEGWHRELYEGDEKEAPWDNYNMSEAEWRKKKELSALKGEALNSIIDENIARMGKDALAKKIDSLSYPLLGESGFGAIHRERVVEKMKEKLRGSDAADAVSTPTKPKTVKEGKAFVNSNIGKQYTDGKKTYEITGLTKDGEVSVKVTDKIGKSSEATLKLSGALTRIFGTKKTNAVWGEVKATDSEQKSPNRSKTTAETPKTEAKRNESGSEAEVKKPAKPLKSTPKKAAEVVKEFASKDESRPLINHIHHDHDRGLAVATDGRILIATKHGYDPNYKEDSQYPFPKWRKVVPIFKKGEGQTITIGPNAVLEATKTVKRLASGIKSDNMIRIKLPNGEHTFMSVNTLSRVAKAMAANGITDITTEGPFKPLLAKNNDTTIAAMPLRNGDGDVKLGRNAETKIVTFDLESGKVISAPESKISKMRRDFAEKLRTDIAEGRTKEIEWLRTTELYKGLIAAQKKGETDAKKVYEGTTREDGSWDKLSEANKKFFTEMLATKDTAELENKFAEYTAKMKDSKKTSPRNDWVERTPKELAKLEKEIAAEDAIDAMMADAEPKPAPKSETKAEAKSETAPSITPAEAMKKLGSLGAADVDTLSKALAREERAGHTERANMIRILRDYKRGVGTNSNPQSDETSGGKYRASVEAAKPLDDPAFVAWAKKRGVAPTTQKRNEYDKAMADMLTNRLSRWIKGVTVKTVNFIAPEEGGDVRAAKEVKAESDSKSALSEIAKGKDYGVLHNNTYGEIKYPLGRSGKKGMGFLHIVEHRMNEGASLDEAIDVALKVGIAAEIGTETKNVLNTRHLDYDGVRAIIAIQNGNVIVTGYEIDADENTAAIRRAARHNPHPHVGSDEVISALRKKLSATENSLSQSTDSDKSVRLLHDGERIVGSYNRATGEVKLAKGESVETVLHELGWHAARHWAEVNADSDPKAKALLEQMKKYAESAPEEIKDVVRDVYGDLDADTLLDEIGAARFTKEQSGKIAKALATKEGAAWYKKIGDKVKEFFKNFLTKIGYNRVDLDGVENMSPDVFGDFLADVMMSGKQLGERTAFSMEAPKGLLARWTTSHSDYKAPIAELEKRVTGSSNNIYYLARTLEGMAQRGKNRAERAIKRVEKILGDDVSPELLAQYMQLKAYEERNAKIERRNGKADASGMTPEDAKAIEKTINESGVDEAIFEEAAQILWDLQKEGLQARVDAGLLDQETANKWMTDEPHHIPWKDAVDPDSGEYVGRKVGASEFDTAEGRKTAASGDPITWMLQEYQDAMTRAAQNRLRSSIANLTRLNGDVGIIYDGIQTDSKGKRSFIKYPKDGGKAKVLSIPEGVKIESTVKNDGGMKNVITFKEGDETKYLVLNGTLGEAVAGAVTGRTLARPIPYLGAWNRISSATATTFSWAFAFKNYHRDTKDLWNNFTSDFGEKKGIKLLWDAEKYSATHMKELWRYAMDGALSLDEKGKPTTEFAKLVLEYEDAGGLMSGNAVQSYEHTEKKIRADFRFGKNRARSIVKGALDIYLTVPKLSEFVTRIGAFAALRKDGMSAKDAAMWTRESTFDFDKKGALAPALNSLWLFSNANIQATHRQLRGLIKSKNGWKAAANMAIVGFVMHMANALLNAANDDDDEKEGLGIDKDISEYDRQHYIFLRFGQKTFRTPVNLGPYGFARYIGDVTARMMTGDISIGEAAKNLGISAAEISATFSGVPINMGAVLQTATPSAGQELIQLATGKNFAGFDVYKNKHPNNKTPDSHYGKRTTAPAYKWIAEKLNAMTGGNEAKPGGIDISPEAVELIVKGLGKSVLRDITDLSRIPNALFLEAKDIDGNDSRYYDVKAAYGQDKHELNHRSDLKGDERRAYLKEHPWLYSAGKPGVTRIDNIVKRIEKLRDIEESDRATEERKAEAKAMRRKLQARVIEIMKGR